MNRIMLRGAQVITIAPNRPDTERADILIEGGRPRCRGVQSERALAATVARMRCLFCF